MFGKVHFEKTSKIKEVVLKKRNQAENLSNSSFTEMQDTSLINKLIKNGKVSQNNRREP